MKKCYKKFFAVLSALAIMCAFAVPAFAADSAASEAVSAMQAGLSEVTGTLSIGNIVSVLTLVLGIAVGFIFFWWGIRKVIAITKRSFAGRGVNV